MQWHMTCPMVHMLQNVTNTSSHADQVIQQSRKTVCVIMRAFKSTCKLVTYVKVISGEVVVL